VIDTHTPHFGPSERHFFHEMSADSSGVYVAGQKSDTLPNQNSLGDIGAFLVKLGIDDDNKK
jgi:hypothetical protein